MINWSDEERKLVGSWIKIKEDLNSNISYGSLNTYTPVDNSELGWENYTKEQYIAGAKIIAAKLSVDQKLILMRFLIELIPI